MAQDNKTIGKFHLDSIPPAPRGVPQIEVTFDIDANGILNVSAKDLGTGKEQKITITANSGLSEDEIKNMVNDAQAHADEDKKRKDAVDTKNRAESMVFQLEKQLKEYGDKLPDSVKKPIEDDISKLKSAIDANDTDRMNTVMKEMEAHMQAMGQEIYKNVQAQQQAGGQQAGGAQGGNPFGGTNPFGGANPFGGGQQPNEGGNNGGSKKDDGDVIDADFTDTTDK